MPPTLARMQKCIYDTLLAALRRPTCTLSRCGAGGAVACSVTVVAAAPWRAGTSTRAAADVATTSSSSSSSCRANIVLPIAIAITLGRTAAVTSMLRVRSRRHEFTLQCRKVRPHKVKRGD